MRFAIAAVMLAVTGGQANATFIVVSPSDDEGFSSFGDSIGADVYLRVFGDPFLWRAGLEFSLAGITPGSTINSATLFLSDRGSSTNGTIQVHGYSGDGNVTFADMSVNNQIASFATAAGVSADYNLNVTSFVQSLVNANQSFGGFMLRSSVEGGVAGADIASNEFSDSQYRPTLSIDYTPATVTPEPTSLALAGFAGLGMAAGAWRRRRQQKQVA